ncbi:MAG: energy transducer TonB [Rhizomicrobium sp.]
MIGARTLAFAALVLAVPSLAAAQDTRARVDTSKSHIVVYPKGFETSAEQGVVTLAVGVGTDGLVSHVGLAQSSGHHDLDVAGIETVMNWHFVPATHDGDVHPDEITLRVVYDRPDSTSAAPAEAH